MGPQRVPLHGLALAMVTIALALGNFMQVLDTTIANVAVPSIAGNLGVSAAQATWVITSYGVTNAISMLMSGWLAQRYGQVRVFAVAVFLFTVASLLCGLATSFGMLLAFRVLQGSVSGLMVPMSQTLLMASWPKERQGLALAIWGMTVMVAPVVGPILGGWITDNVGWSWVFYINVPIGLVVTLMTRRLLAGRETQTRHVSIDIVGLGSMALWVGALQILLDKGNDQDWFGSTFIVGLAIIAVIGFAVFVVWEWTDEHPIVNLRLFRMRNFGAGTLAVSLGFGVHFGSIVLLPLWLQTTMGYTATWAGLAMAPLGLLAFVLSPIVGRGIKRIDPRLFATVAFLIFATSSFWRASYTPDIGYWALIWPQFLQGAGLAMFFAPLMAIALGELEPEQMAFGSGLANFARNTAGSFGASLVITFWQRREALHHSQLAARISIFGPWLDAAAGRLDGLELSTKQALTQINRVITHQAALLGVTDIFWISGWLFALLIGVVWLASKPVAVGAMKAT